MKKVVLLLSMLCLLFISQMYVASAISVDAKDKGSVIIAELENPAVYEFTLTNPSALENIELYTLLGITFSPRGTFEIQSGKNTFEVKAYPPKSVRQLRGQYIFEYQIKGENSGIYKDTLALTIVPLKETLSFEPENFKPSSTHMRLTIKNLQNTYLENVNVQLNSEFFSDQDFTVSLDPYQSTTISVSINKEKSSGLSAGKYLMKIKVGLEDAKAGLEGTLNYLEEQDISVTTHTTGIIVQEKTVTKKNEGNIPVTDSITLTRDIFTRLFTSHSREPTVTKRNGLLVVYEWQNELSPGESWKVRTTTNFTFPFLLILLVIASTIFAMKYARTQVVAHKSVSYVRTKGGQFALKVRLRVKARSAVTNVQIIDRLPGMTKMYEKFGIQPTKIDAATRRIFWNIDKLAAGEERVFSYILYSNLNIVGRFELPAAIVIFDHNGKIEEAPSNRAFFVSETVKNSD